MIAYTVRGSGDVEKSLISARRASRRGAAVSTVNGYLKFRNDALHADWKNVDKATIGACMAAQITRA